MSKKRYYRKKKRKTTSIYEIRAGNHFYIGKANNPWARLEIHKKKAIKDLGSNKRKNKVFRQNITKLRLRIISRPKMKDWREAEIKEIAKYRKKYGRSRVLNMSDGGDGQSGGGHKDKDKSLNSLHNSFIGLMFILSACGSLYYWT